MQQQDALPAADKFACGLLLQFLVPLTALILFTLLWTARTFGPTILAALRSLLFLSVLLAENVILFGFITTLCWLPYAELIKPPGLSSLAADLPANIYTAMLSILIALGATALALASLVCIQLVAFRTVPRSIHDFAIAQWLCRQPSFPISWKTNSHSEVGKFESVLAAGSPIRCAVPSEDVSESTHPATDSPVELLPEADASHLNWLEELNGSGDAVVH